MNINDVGSLYTTNGEDIWQMITFCEHPTATMQNVKTGQKIGGAVGSSILQPFIKLIPERTILEEKKGI